MAYSLPEGLLGSTKTPSPWAWATEGRRQHDSTARASAPRQRRALSTVGATWRSLASPLPTVDEMSAQALRVLPGGRGSEPPDDDPPARRRPAPVAVAAALVITLAVSFLANGFYLYTQWAPLALIVFALTVALVVL